MEPSIDFIAFNRAKREARAVKQLTGVDANDPMLITPITVDGQVQVP